MNNSLLKNRELFFPFSTHIEELIRQAHRITWTCLLFSKQFSGKQHTTQLIFIYAMGKCHIIDSDKSVIVEFDTFYMFFRSTIEWNMFCHCCCALCDKQVDIFSGRFGCVKFELNPRAFLQLFFWVHSF